MKAYLSAIISSVLLSVPGFSQTFVDRVPPEKRTCEPQNTMNSLLHVAQAKGMVRTTYVYATGETDLDSSVSRAEIGLGLDSINQKVDSYSEIANETREITQDIKRLGLGAGLQAVGLACAGIAGASYLLRGAAAWKTFAFVGGVTLNAIGEFILFTSATDPEIPSAAEIQDEPFRLLNVHPMVAERLLEEDEETAAAVESFNKQFAKAIEKPASLSRPTL